jgi:hypothetical protein
MSRYDSYEQFKTVHQALEQYTVPDIKELAGLIASHLPTRKADLMQVIETYLNSQTNLRQIWRQLDEIQQAAVAEMLHSGELTFDEARFKAKYGQKPNWGGLQNSGYYGRPKQQPTLLRLLFYRGQIPLDLQAKLKAFVSPPRAVKIKTASPPATIPQKYHDYNYETGKSTAKYEDIPVIQLDTERAARQDILAVLRLIDLGKVRASAKTNRVTAAGAKAITEVLFGGDFYASDEKLDDYGDSALGPIKAFAWPLLLQSAGLVELAGTKLQLTAAGRKVLNKPPEETIKTAWKRWQKTTILDEFSRIHPIKGQTGSKGKRQLTAVSGRRAVIASALAECPPHEWLEFDEFSRYMRAANHTFEVARDLWPFYIVDPQYGSLGYSGFGEWPIVQGRYLLAVLFEYAATLGLIDVAYIHPSGARADFGTLWGSDDLDCLSRYDGLLYFRLNSLGAWVLGLTSTYTPSPITEAQILKVLPNFDVVATGPLPAGDQLLLEQFAAQTADNVWKIDRAALLKAVEAGQTVEMIQDFLRAKSGGELPQPVQLMLDETAERLSSLTSVGEALLIEAKDAALAQIIANDSSLRSLCLLAGEQTIVVPKENETKFRRNLRKLGYGVISS